VRRGVAVVTGAGSGIGAATALALAAEDWRVVRAGRRPEALRAVADRDDAGRLHPVPTDVTDEASVRALFDTAVTPTDGWTWCSTTRAAPCPRGRSTPSP
jgi:NADP-dependent 3-hydroxy acid dehydrogenase YdfG